MGIVGFIFKTWRGLVQLQRSGVGFRSHGEFDVAQGRGVAVPAGPGGNFVNAAEDALLFHFLRVNYGHFTSLLTPNWNPFFLSSESSISPLRLYLFGAGTQEEFLPNSNLIDAI